MDAKAELSLQALSYVVKQTALGNLKAPKALNISEEQANELLTLNNQELHDMALSANLNILTITFDPEALKIALEINNAKSSRRQSIFEMLEAGASYPVMHHLYGLTTVNIGYYRRMIGFPEKEKKGGRPTCGTEAEKILIWELIGKTKGRFNNPELSKLLLTAHKKTGLKISTIWTILKEVWEESNKDTDISAR